MTITTRVRPSKLRAGDTLVRDGMAHRVESVQRGLHKWYEIRLVGRETALRVHANEHVDVLELIR